MKQYLFILVLIASIGLLLAVESDPSATVGYVKYGCVTGDNFVAMPMNYDPGTLVSTVMLPYNTVDDVNTVNVWDPIGQGWVAATNYGGNYFEPDPEVGPGSVLFFNSYNPFTFYSLGALPPTDAMYDIVFGDNTIMIPLNHSDLTIASEVGMSIDPVSDAINTINLWDSIGQGWVAATNYGGNYFEPDPAVTIGTPLFANSSFDGTITWNGPARNQSSPISTSKSKIVK